jgi:transcriptional regulator with XRE-family HTH domain
VEKTIYSEEYDLFRRMIREERERLHLTQGELGRKVGKHQPFIARIETGQRRLDVIEFRHLLHAMGIAPVAFFERLEARINEEIPREASIQTTSSSQRETEA